MPAIPGLDHRLSRRVRAATSGAESRRPGLAGWIPWGLHSRLHPARRVALALVAAFEIWEALLLWRRGLDGHDPTPLILGHVLLLLLLGFELAERAAARRERELGREIAEWILPRVAPSIPRLEIAFSHRRVEHVASDYYNVFPRWARSGSAGENHVFIAIADVAGLGVQGALLMAIFQASLRALAETRMPLCELAAQMNRWSWDRSVGGRNFVMAFFAELHPGTGALQYVNAGHQPPLLLRRDSPSEALTLGGFPLGAIKDSGFEVGSTVLAPGDTLALFTDGAIAAEDHRGEAFGEARLRRSLENARGLGADEVLDLLRTSVLSFAGTGPLRDDISLLVVRRTV